jgi:hypothetical protein
VQKPNDNVVGTVLDFFRWMAERAGIDRAIGVGFAFTLLGIGWRIYIDRRRDKDRTDDVTERNRTIHVLERELVYVKARELALASGMSLDEAHRIVSSLSMHPVQPSSARRR